MRLFFVIFAALLVVSCKSYEPGTAEYWVHKLKKEESRIEALKELGKLGQEDPSVAAKAKEPMLKLLNQEGEWQPDAAYALGLLGDPSVASELVAAIDYTATGGRDKLSRQKSRTNINIAKALGELKAKDQTEALIRLMETGPAPTREAAIKALGEIGDRSATDKLIDRALNDKEPFLRKVAIQALGNLGDPKAVPALVKMMYVEVPAISFYNEARFSLVQIGKPAIPELLKTLRRDNKEVEKVRLANGSPIAPGAIEAKSASVLGTLRATEAEKDMVAALTTYYGKFQRRDKEPVFASIPGAVIELVYALGDLGTPGAAKAIEPVAKDSDPRVRKAAAEALTFAGARSATDTLLAAAKSGPAEARQVAIVAASRLAPGSKLPTFDSLTKSGDKTVPEATMKKLVESERPRVLAAKECEQKAECWKGKLGDKEAAVRERAAYELGWAGGKEFIDDLIKTASDENVDVRMASVYSLGRIDGVDPKRLQEVHEEWKGKIANKEVNRQLRQVIARLESTKQ